jgi:hypothetical protein
MTLKVYVSAGEFLDKKTILEIKSERIKDEDKLRNIHKELDLLRKTWDESPLSKTDVSPQVEDLKKVNENLWDIEDQIRLKEAAQTFDGEFVLLARSVYQFNDKRAAIKRELNRILGSDLIEEKSYPDYSPPST